MEYIKLFTYKERKAIRDSLPTKSKLSPCSATFIVFHGIEVPHCKYKAWFWIGGFGERPGKDNYKLLEKEACRSEEDKETGKHFLKSESVYKIIKTY